MAELCLATIARSLKFNGEAITISSKTVAIAVLASLPILSALNLHAKSLWSLALGIRSYRSGSRAAAEIAVGERMKEKDGAELQCVICLCDVSEGEVYRLLPQCNHGFHLSCIDVWLQTHSSCPLCRCPVPCSSRKQAKNEQEQHLIDAIVSYFLSLLDHVCTWFVNPLGLELTSNLSEDYRSVL